VILCICRGSFGEILPAWQTYGVGRLSYSEDLSAAQTLR